MSAFSDAILFAVNLAANLFLFGLFIAGSIAATFGLIKNAAPRLRYAVAVAAFLLAAFFPVVVTLNGSTGLEMIFEAKQTVGANAFDDAFDDQNSFVKPDTISTAPKTEAEKLSFDSLNNLTSAVAGSFAGIVLFVLWILAAMAFLSRDFVAHRRLKKWRRTWREATDSERAELALSDETPLYFGDESPATIGLWRPVIVLPERFPEDLSLAAKRFIVRHEAAHARWRDPLVNSLLRLIRAAFWISPALWMLERIAADEREAAADYAAIADGAAGNSKCEAAALNYAAALVSVARHYNLPARRGSLRANSIGLGGGSAGRLENRVRRLLTRSTETARLRLFLASMIFAFSLTGMLFMPVAFQAKQTDETDETIIVTDQKPENLPDNDNLKNSTTSRQNNWQRVVENKNKEGKTKTVAAQQNENQPREFSNETRKNAATPPLVFQSPTQTGKVNQNPDDGSTEKLMKQLSRQDEKNSEMRRKLTELSDKLQTLDKAKENLGNDILRMRQKAAAESDAKMMQTRTNINPSQNININININ